MMIPTDAWLAIVSYRDFHDVPRLILAADKDSRYWVLDSSFDDEEDEYSASFNVHFVGREPEQAQRAFEVHAKGTKEDLVGVVSVAQVEFDPTKRRQLLLKQK